MTDNILDFEEFADRKLDREEQVDLRAERDALMAFIKRSDAHANFAKVGTNQLCRVRHVRIAAIHPPRGDHGQGRAARQQCADLHR